MPKPLVDPVLFQNMAPSGSRRRRPRGEGLRLKRHVERVARFERAPRSTGPDIALPDHRLRVVRGVGVGGARCGRGAAARPGSMSAVAERGGEEEVMSTTRRPDAIGLLDEEAGVHPRRACRRDWCPWRSPPSAPSGTRTNGVSSRPSAGRSPPSIAVGLGRAQPVGDDRAEEADAEIGIGARGRRAARRASTWRARR